MSLFKFADLPYFPDFLSEDSPSTAGDVSEEQVQPRTQVSRADTSKIRKKDDEDQVEIAVTAKLGGLEVTVSSTEGSQIIIGGRFVRDVNDSHKATSFQSIFGAGGIFFIFFVVQASICLLNFSK